MFDDKPVLTRGATALLVFFALMGAGVASAKVFSTTSTVEEIRLDAANNEVIYTLPTLEQVSWALTQDNQVLMVTDAAVHGSISSTSDVVGSLTLTSHSTPNGYEGRFEYTMFGSLQSGENEQTNELVTGVIGAMQTARDQESLHFLLSGEETAVDGVLLRDIGIYAAVWGIGESQWLAQYSAEPTDLFASQATQSREPANNPMPLPATPWLVILGLAGLRLLRRR